MQPKISTAVAMLKKNAISLIVAIVLITPITVFALVHWMEKKWSALPVLNGPKQQLTNLQLTNQQGQTVSLDQCKGKTVVAGFFFTHCPVICPKMTASLKKVGAAFPDNPDLLFILFSVDPARDSVPVLKRYAERFGISGNWHLLTGDKTIIYGLACQSFAITATEGDGSESDFIHSEKLVLVDRQQRIRGYYNGTAAADVQQLIQDINKLQDEK
jgi:protein SCO1/2